MNKEFKFGDLVEVHNSFNENIDGLTGEITNIQYELFWVMIPKHGSFTLDKHELILLSKKKQALYKVAKLYYG